MNDGSEFSMEAMIIGALVEGGEAIYEGHVFHFDFAPQVDDEEGIPGMVLSYWTTGFFFVMV